MMAYLTPVLVWLNTLANKLGWLLAPIGLLPGWLSATLVACATGIVMLLAFKYTSNQSAIKRVRRDIKAHLLALKLFKESMPVSLRAQGRVLLGALRLLLLALVPMLVMLVPMVLLLGQLSLWYEASPFRVGDEAVLTMKLNGDRDAHWPEVNLQPTDAIKEIVGPVRVRSQREICWSVRARQIGTHHLVFLVDGQPVDKELVVGDGFMRVSAQRPARQSPEMWVHPGEIPLPPDSPVHSIAIDYPPRSSWTSGTGWWVVYFFVVSLVAGFSLRRVLNVNL
jgi:uncharacterized membrane protein (DUF106 family)